MQCESSETTDFQPAHSRMCFEQPLLQNSPYTVLRRGRAFARRATVRDWTLSCAAPSDIVTVLKTLQQSVTCFLLLLNLCSSVCSTMIYTYCNRYYRKTSFSYNLRPRHHNRQLPRNSAYVNDSCFITRMLYSNSY